MEYNITRKERDCIVALHENSGFPIRLFNIADILKIKAPTAFELIKRLESKNIISKTNGVISLTPYGNSIYSEIIMAHRTLELILTKSGVNSDMACEQIEKIDYLMDDASVQKLFKSLGQPQTCPHGKPVKLS
ncbi:metal-dependent transcriptional regulator [Ferroplasma sp.]|uniref:metal-dependent transcriptional regulator n=1 Tax=Ferroplasma sp. TaxID=2591003 RepID=UPI00260E4C82|nr:metal-dependent transcriptional regulator [Ferroplasma sp.]MCL4453129.1 metal-dependent transcriptional regulator [Candidatus Thermoplasmatota archaeon]